MNAQIQIFCAMAIGRRLLTLQQCELLINYCAADPTPENILQVLEEHGSSVDPHTIHALNKEIGGSPPRPTPNAKSESKTGQTEPLAPEALAVQWFCSLAVQQRLLPQRACRSVVARLSKPIRFRPFIQQMHESELMTPQHIEVLERTARVRAETLEPPILQVLDDELFNVPSPSPSTESASHSPAPLPRTEMPRAVITRVRQPSPPSRSPDAAAPNVRVNIEVEPPPSLGRPLELQKRIYFGPNLTEPHDRFPFWKRQHAYNRITSMYLENPDAEAIAQLLSEERQLAISTEQVEEVRREAASAAADLSDIDRRRRWAWRHPLPTLRNLVLEYMFIVDEADYHKAKRELAQEIAYFLKSVDASHLLVAVNDALGRSDIQWRVVLEFEALYQAAAKLEQLAARRGEDGERTPHECLVDVARRLGEKEVQAGQPLSPAQSAEFIAQLLECRYEELTSDDVGYIRGLERLENEEAVPTPIDERR